MGHGWSRRTSRIIWRRKINNPVEQFESKRFYFVLFIDFFFWAKNVGVMRIQKISSHTSSCILWKLFFCLSYWFHQIINLPNVIHNEVCLQSNRTLIRNNFFSIPNNKLHNFPLIIIPLESNAVSNLFLPSIYTLMEGFFGDASKLRQYDYIEGIHTFKLDLLGDKFVLAENKKRPSEQDQMNRKVVQRCSRRPWLCLRPVQIFVDILSNKDLFASPADFRSFEQLP